MKQKLKKMMALLMCIVFIFTYVGEAALAAEGDSSDIATVNIEVKYGQTEARTMLDMINEFRTGDDAWVWNEDDTTKTTYTDLKELVYDYNLERIAMQRAAEVALSFSHTRPDGTVCFTAYGDHNYTYYSENLAAGYNTASAAFEGLQETDKDYTNQGHRRNMLSSSVTAVGIGHVYFNGTHYWVQEFGDPASGAAAVTANDSETTVAIDVLLSDATVSVSADPASLTVPLEQSEDLPVLNTTVQMKEAWPSKASTVTVDYVWSVSDGQYASISGNKVTGVKTGNTSLTTSALGQTVSVPLTVICDHTYDKGVVTTEATCTETGVKTYTCTKCGDTYTEEIEALGHDYGAWTVKKQATCTEEGERTRTCSRCGDVQTENIAKTEHTPEVIPAVEATCTAAGKTEGSKCSVCGIILKEQETVPATGHTYVYTDNGDGTHTAACESGDDSYTEAHTYVNGVCSICGSRKILDTPQLASVSNTAKGVTVKWNKVTEAEKYRVYRKSGDSSWKRIADTTSTSYTDTTAKSGTTYAYTVRCISNDGSNVISGYDKTGLSIKYLSSPQVSSTSNTASGITVKWKKVTGASGYYIYRKTESGKWTSIATVKGGSTVSYTDKDVKSQNGTVYSYTVRAYSGKTRSYYESGKTICRLTTPAISELTNVKTNKMTVTWKKDSKVTGYQIQYSTSSKFESVTTVTVKKNSTTSTTISKLTKNKKYYVRIRKYKNVSGKNYYSGWSSAKSIKIVK